jgi:probable HAF family extracellular repeat protein
MSVNVNGQVVGSSQTAGGEVHAFYWYDGQIHDLNTVLAEQPEWGTEGFQVLGEATAINEDGVIVGCGHAQGQLRGFLMLPLTGDPSVIAYEVRDLGELPGAVGCIPRDINEMQQVVGESGPWPFVAQYRQMRPLELFSRSPYFTGCAHAINDNGVAVGWFSEGKGDGRTGCRWESGLRFTLGHDDCVTEATDLNNHGTAVGFVCPPAGAIFAVRWDGSEPTNLNAVTAIPLRTPRPSYKPSRGPAPDTWTGPLFTWANLDHAIAINDGGFIAGYGHGSDGRTRAFLLRPLPPVEQ